MGQPVGMKFSFPPEIDGIPAYIGAKEEGPGDPKKQKKHVDGNLGSKDHIMTGGATITATSLPNTLDGFERRTAAIKALREMGMPVPSRFSQTTPQSNFNRFNPILGALGGFGDTYGGNILEASTRLFSSVATPIWYGINDWNGLMNQTNSGGTVRIPQEYQVDFRYNINHLGNLRFQFTKVDGWGHNTPTLQQAANTIDGALSIGSFGYRITPVPSVLDGPLESFVRQQAINTAVKTPISLASKKAAGTFANNFE